MASAPIICAGYDMKITWLDKTLRYSLWGMLLLLPFEEFSATAFLLVAAVAAAAICIREKHLPVRGTFCVALSGMVVCIIASMRFSPDVAYGIQIFFFTIFRYMLAAFAASVYASRYGIKQFMLAVTVAAVFSTAYGYWQIVFQPFLENKEWIDAEKFGDITFRIFGTWGNPNIFGGYMLFAFTAALISARSFRADKVYRISFYILAIVFVATIFLTFSRGVWLALFAMLAVLALQRGKKKILLLVLPLVLLFSTVSMFWQRLHSAFSAGDSSSVMRLALWASTEKMINVHPVFGWGWGLYWFYYPQFDYLLQTAGLKVYHAHNTYLHYAAEIGIAGLVFFLAILLFAIYHSVVNACVYNRREYRYLTALLIGFMALSLTDHILFNTRMSMLFWSFIGITFSTYRRDDDTSTSDRSAAS